MRDNGGFFEPDQRPIDYWEGPLCAREYVTGRSLCRNTVKVWDEGIARRPLPRDGSQVK